MAQSLPTGSPELSVASLHAETFAPFEVDFNAQEILDRFPQVGPMLDIDVGLLGAARMLSEHDLRRLGVTPGNSRQARRWATRNSVPDALINLDLSLAHLVNGLATESERADEIHRTVDGILDGAHGYIISPYVRKNIFGTLPEDVEEIHSFVKGVNTYAQPLQEKAYREIAEDPRAEYELLKLILTVESADLHKEADNNLQRKEDLKALRWLTMLLNIDRTSAGSPIARLFESGLKRGEYDQFIARDLLNWQKDNKEKAGNKSDLNHTTNFVGLIEFAAGHELDGSGIDRLARSLAFWPREAKKEVELHRGILDRQLSYIKRSVTLLGGGGLYEPGKNYLEEVSSGIHDVLAFLSRGDFQLVKRLGGHALNGNGNGTENGNGNGTKRRHLAKVETEHLPAFPSAEVKEREPLTLAFLDPRGYLHPSGSPEYDSMLDSFLGKYRGASGLEEDVRRIFNHLEHLDLSNGFLISGIKKIKRAPARVMREKDGKEIETRETLWEFDPAKAHGISLTTNIGSRTRTVFCLLDGQTLAIAGITHREQLDQLVKRYAVTA